MEEEKTPDDAVVADLAADISQDTPAGCDAQPDVTDVVASPNPPPSDYESAQDVADDSPVNEECSAGTAPGDEQESESAPSCDGRVLDALDVIADRVGAMQAGLTKLGGDVATLQKAVAGYYTTNTDSMHKELEKHRKGLLRKMDQELFAELIELYDAADSAVAKASDDTANALPLLKGLRDQIDAALFNRGIEKREAVVGEKFDPRRHHATRPDVPTGDKSLDGMVAATAKAGFDDMDESFSSLRGGCMKLRPTWVRLYRYDESLDSPSDMVPPDSELQTADEVSADIQ